MANPELQQALTNLHGEMSRIEVVDDKTRDLLQLLQRDIQNILERTEEEEPDNLRERLEDAVVNLETEHPGLATAIMSVVNTLSNAGI